MDKYGHKIWAHKSGNVAPREWQKSNPINTNIEH
jgi:hypothetical protein